MAVWRPVDAASFSRQLESVWQPDRVAGAALAPDGRHVAFAVRGPRGIDLHVWNLAQPDAEAARARLDPRPNARLTFFAWATAERLIAVPDAPVVFALERHGREAVTWLDEKSLPAVIGQRRSGRPAMRVLRLVPATGDLTLEVAWHAPGEDVILDVVAIGHRTGERRLVHTRRVGSAGGILLADQQGRPRLLFDRGERPQQYLYLSGDGEERARAAWRPLDRRLAEGSTLRFHLTPQDLLGERAFPLGFAAEPDVLYFATNDGRDTFGLYTLDLTSGRRSPFTLEDPTRDLADPAQPFDEAALVLDRATGRLAGIRGAGTGGATHWFDAELTGVQAAVAEKFPGRTIELREWDAGRTRFLVRVAALHDPGRWFVFHRDDGRCVEFFREGALTADEVHPAEWFSIEQPAGGRLTGRLTRPRGAARPPPLVVWWHDGPGRAVRPEYSREAQALAAQGFAVLQVNYRGSAGFGRRHREALRESFDRGPVDDARAALGAFLDAGDFDRTRVLAGGEGFGGYVALRAAQLEPAVFRGVAVINAPLDLAELSRPSAAQAARLQATEARLAPSARAILETPRIDDSITGTEGGSFQRQLPAEPVDFGGGPWPAETFEREFLRWFFAPAAREKIAVSGHLDDLRAPVLFVHDPRHPMLPLTAVRQVRDQLVRRKQVAELVELPPEFAAGDAVARATVWRRIGEFLAAAVAVPPAGAPEVSP